MAFGYPPNSDCIYYTTVLCKIQPFFFAGELFPRGDHPLALPYLFIIKVRRRLRAQPQPSAQYYISMGCGDDIPAGVQGQRSCRDQGVEPLVYSRAFSDMCGESAPAMTQRGEHACVRSARNAGVPGRKSLIFGWGKSPTKTNACIRFAFGRKGAWRRRITVL